MLDVPDDKFSFSFIKIKGKSIKHKLHIFIKYFLDKEIFSIDHSFWHNRNEIGKVASNFF